MDLELDYSDGHSQLQDQAGLAAAIVDGLSNDTVRDLHTPHPCIQHKGKEKERRKEKESVQCVSPIDRSSGEDRRMFKATKTAELNSLHLFEKNLQMLVPTKHKISASRLLCMRLTFSKSVRYLPPSPIHITSLLPQRSI